MGGFNEKMGEKHADGTIFLEIFGDSPINKILDFLVVFDQFDYSLTDIAKKSGVSYSTIQLIWDDLERCGIVVQSRTVGKAKMYRLNQENPIVKSFITFYWDVTKAVTEHRFSSKKSKRKMCVA